MGIRGREVSCRLVRFAWLASMVLAGCSPSTPEQGSTTTIPRCQNTNAFLECPIPCPPDFATASDAATYCASQVGPIRGVSISTSACDGVLMTSMWWGKDQSIDLYFDADSGARVGMGKRLFNACSGFVPEACGLGGAVAPHCCTWSTVDLPLPTCSPPDASATD